MKVGEIIKPKPTNDPEKLRLREINAKVEKLTRAIRKAGKEGKLDDDEVELAVQVGLTWVQDWTADRFTLEYELSQEVVERLKELDCWPWVESDEWLT